MAVNKRSFFLATAILGIALVVGAVVFSGERKTMASRSAAALREALRKGEPVGATHGGHGASPMTKSEMSAHGTSPSGASGGDNAMPGMSMPGMSASGHAGMQHEMPDMPPTDSAAAGHAGMQHGMAGMQHGTTGMATPGPAAGPAGMQHGTTGMQHGMTGMQPGMAGMPPRGTAAGSMSPGTQAVALPQAKAASASPGQPAGTLRPDPLDRPAETSVVDATRSLEMAREMGNMEGMQHGLTSYRQLDAGRGAAMTMPEGKSGSPGSSVAPTTQAPAPDHRGMRHGSPQPSPTPVSRPTPPPSEKKPSTLPVAPTHSPHHHPGGSSGGSGQSGDPR